jgi:hypothetical protein
MCRARRPGSRQRPRPQCCANAAASAHSWPAPSTSRRTSGPGASAPTVRRRLEPSWKSSRSAGRTCCTRSRSVSAARTSTTSSSAPVACGRSTPRPTPVGASGAAGTPSGSTATDAVPAQLAVRSSAGTAAAHRSLWLPGVRRAPARVPHRHPHPQRDHQPGPCCRVRCAGRLRTGRSPGLDVEVGRSVTFDGCNPVRVPGHRGQPVLGWGPPARGRPPPRWAPEPSPRGEEPPAR